MRRSLILIIILIVLLATLFGVYRAFTLPAEIEEPIVVLNYEHRGEFDYLAHVKASYLYGDIPLEATEVTAEEQPANLKYPTEMIDTFDMTFSYRCVPNKPVVIISEEVEVKAFLDKEETGREEIDLVPTTEQTEDFTVEFSLEADDIIESTRITITAVVYTTIETDTGPIFESFTQNLTMRQNGPLLEVTTALARTEKAAFGELSYEQIGDFDYSILLKEDSPFGDISLQPPSVTPVTSPVELSSKTLGPQDVLYSKLFDSMDVTFFYQFESDRPVSEIAEEVEINAVLENPGVWSKEFILVPHTEKSGDFTATFSLDTDDFNHFNDVFRAIEKETGAAIPRKLTIKADVHTTALTDFGPVDEDFSQTISTILGGDVIGWEEELVKSKPSTIEITRMVPNPNRLVWLSISEARIVFLTSASIFMALFLYLLALYVKFRFMFKPGILYRIEEEALRARKKHKGVIVDVKELPEVGFRETIIPLNSLEELVKTADALFKPVLHKAEAGRHTYSVFDAQIRYEYTSEVEHLDDKEKLGE